MCMAAHMYQMNAVTLQLRMKVPLKFSPVAICIWNLFL